MNTRIYIAIMTALLILSAMCATAAAEYAPIEDNGMKAYVWYSTEGIGWDSICTRIAGIFSSQGFDVTLHVAPNETTILQTIADEDVKIYLGMGHGCDWDASTGNGLCYATNFGATVSERESPLTIGVFQHCGEYLCYTPGRWLQESTQGNDNVVAQRFYGEGWCGNPAGDGGEYLESLGIGIVPLGFGTDRMWAELNAGYTYEDAVNRCSWSVAEGRKQGNRDLRYPQFCGDVNYDKVVNTADATLLQNHVNDPSTYPVHSEWDADVNGDGSVDSCDAMLLELHVGSPEEFPLYPRGWFADNPTTVTVASLKKDTVIIRGTGFGDDESDWSSATVSCEGVPLETEIATWDDSRVVVYCSPAPAPGDIATISTLYGSDSMVVTGRIR